MQLMAGHGVPAGSGRRSRPHQWRAAGFRYAPGCPRQPLDNVVLLLPRHGHTPGTRQQPLAADLQSSSAVQLCSAARLHGTYGEPMQRVKASVFRRRGWRCQFGTAHLNDLIDRPGPGRHRPGSRCRDGVVDQPRRAPPLGDSSSSRGRPRSTLS